MASPVSEMFIRVRPDTSVLDAYIGRLEALVTDVAEALERFRVANDLPTPEEGDEQ